MPLPEWFNMSAPRIKSGEVNPNDFDEVAAINAMIDDPYLIRRPLIDVGFELACGFDNLLVKKLLGESTDISYLQFCPNIEKTSKCD
jgi:hypothetical protein